VKRCERGVECALARWVRTGLLCDGQTASAAPVQLDGGAGSDDELGWTGEAAVDIQAIANVTFQVPARACCSEQRGGGGLSSVTGRLEEDERLRCH